MRFLTMTGMLASVLLGGCTWISPSDLDCQLELVDDDGDGYPLNEVEDGYTGSDRCNHLTRLDCDDTEPTIHPDADDPWYDGVDADCLADDDYDQDGDGYVPDEYVGMETAGVESSGGLPGGDCDDELGSINPSAADAWYDGIDSDCGGQDDFDQDADGYVEDTYIGMATTYVAGSGALPGGDCDDLLAGVNPGQDDTWYDGVDTDCGGEDDYDRDADSYVPDEYLGLPTTYVDGSGALPGGDCDDDNRRIHPGATDAWYDGEDSDCAGDDDFDQDVDGHRDLATTTDGDDCDDTDATSYPGAGEVFGDGVDHDCDGDPDTFPLDDVPGSEWENPRALQLVGDATNVLMALSFDRGIWASTTYHDTAFALTLDPADPATGFYRSENWLSSTTDSGPNPLTDGFDVGVDSTVLYGVIGIQNTSTRQTVLRGRNIGDTVAFGVSSPLTAPLGFDDTSVAVNATGDIHAVGCTTEDHAWAMSYLWAQAATLRSSRADDTAVYAVRARTCDLDFYDTSGDGVLVLGRYNEPVPEDTGLVPVDTADTADTAVVPVDTADTAVVPVDTADTADTAAVPVDTADSAVLPADTGDTGAVTSTTGTTLEIYTFASPASGDSVELVQVAAFDGFDLGSIQVHPWDGGRLLIIADPVASVLAVESLDAAWSLTELMSLPFPADPLLSAASVVAPDGTLYVTTVTEGGDLTLNYGDPALASYLAQVSYDPGFPVEQSAVYVDPGGSLLIIAAAGYDPSEGGDRVVYGYAELGS
ncbi:MAG: MopE-related protein [Pseudomonadota bacterium]